MYVVWIYFLPQNIFDKSHAGRQMPCSVCIVYVVWTMCLASCVCVCVCFVRVWCVLVSRCVQCENRSNILTEFHTNAITKALYPTTKVQDFIHKLWVK